MQAAPVLVTSLALTDQGLLVFIALNSLQQECQMSLVFLFFSVVGFVFKFRESK